MGLLDIFKRGTQEERQKKELAKKDPEYAKLLRDISRQDKQLDKIRAAEAQYEKDGNIENLISFWEDIWSGGGLLFNGSKWTFRLPDLYIKEKRYDDALRILKRIDNPAYQDRKKSYISKIKQKAGR